MKLIAPERWMAAAVERRQADVRSARVLQLEARFGRDGVALLAAGLGTVVLGELVAIIGIALLAVIIAPAAVLIGISAVLIVVSVARIVQAFHVGRTFRQSALG